MFLYDGVEWQKPPTTTNMSITMKEQYRQITMIPLEMIVPDPEQPRKVLRGIERMSRSLSQEGQLNPILVRLLAPEPYQIIDGEQRYRASSGT